MAAMLNRYNRADIYLGVDPSGRILGIDVPDDISDIIINRVGEIVNTMPSVQVITESDNGVQFIHMHVTGYETPYSWKGWFYVRRFHVERDENGEPVTVWAENLTCSMKRH